MNTQLAWMPAPDVVDHYGRPLTSDLEFFAPPPEIGRVLTAFSTLKGGKSHPTLLKASGGALGGFAGGFAFGFFVAWIKGGGSSMGIGVGVILGLIVAGFVFVQAAQAGQCTYVGDRGIARCFYSIFNSGPPKTETLVFENAAQLLAGQTDQYVNGGYTGTQFTSRWVDAGGKTLLTIQGSYDRKKMEKTGLPTSMLYQFIDRAEDVWLRLALERALAEQNKFGYATFRLGDTGEAHVGRDYVEVHAKNGVTRFDGSDIAKLEIKKGTVTLQARDAQKGVLGVGRHGIFTIKYAQVGNARLFLHLVNRLGGYEAALAK